MCSLICLDLFSYFFIGFLTLDACQLLKGILILIFLIELYYYYFLFLFIGGKRNANHC